MKHLLRTLTLLTAFLGGLCLHAQVKPEKLDRYGMDPQRLSRVDTVIGDAIRSGEIPGAVLSVVHRDEIVWLKAYGDKSVVPERVPMTTDTMFDLASLSKCVGTTLSFLQLVEGGQVRLTDPVRRYIPAFRPWVDPKTGEEVDITLRDLLTHSSGLSPYYDANLFVERFGTCQPDSLLKVIATEVERHFRPGSGFLYSCLNFITLQHILEQVTGERLCDYAESHVFQPLGLKHTCYFPLAEDLRTPQRHQDRLPLVAPTEVQADGLPLVGAVHDPLARLANAGNSGNAGVFSDAADLSRICRMIMNYGRPDYRVLSRASIRMMATIPPENDPSVGRALGWDVNSEHSGLRGDLFRPDHMLMHTGYTGTSIVIDLESKTAVILLAHRVHPVDQGGTGKLRARIANIVAGSIEE